MADMQYSIFEVN